MEVQLKLTVVYSYLSGGSKGVEQRRGVFECKREGHTLFKANYVQDFKYNFR